MNLTTLPAALTGSNVTRFSASYECQGNSTLALHGGSTQASHYPLSLTRSHPEQATMCATHTPITVINLTRVVRLCSSVVLSKAHDVLYLCFLLLPLLFVMRASRLVCLCVCLCVCVCVCAHARDAEWKIFYMRPPGWHSVANNVSCWFCLWCFFGHEQPRTQVLALFFLFLLFFFFFLTLVTNLIGADWEGYIGIAVSVCPCVRLSRFSPDDVFWTAQTFVTKLGMMVHRHESECHAKRLIFAVFMVKVTQLM